MKRITIDLNVRVRENQTYTGFDDVQDGALPAIGDQVLAVEPETGIVTGATVTDVDQERELVYLAVDWNGWHDDPKAADDPACE